MGRRKPSPGQMDLFSMPTDSPTPKKGHGGKKQGRNLYQGIQPPLLPQGEYMAIGFDESDRNFAEGDRVLCPLGEGTVYAVTDNLVWVAIGNTARPHAFDQVTKL